MNKRIQMHHLHERSAGVVSQNTLPAESQAHIAHMRVTQHGSALMRKAVISLVLFLGCAGSAAAAPAKSSLADYFNIGSDPSIAKTTSGAPRSTPRRLSTKAFSYARPGRVSMGLNSNETELTIVWDTGVFTDQLGCSFDLSGWPYFELKFDQRTIISGSITGALTTGPGGICTYTYKLKANNGGKLPAGNYRAHFQVLASGSTRVSIGSQAVAACTASRGKRPIYLGYHAQLTDNFYTLSYSDSQFVTTIGYSYLGSPFAMPLPEVLDTVPFDRYYKGHPQYEHFYSTDSKEYQFLVTNGYEFEGTEGDVYTIAKPGTRPLYRYTWFNPTNSDLYHYYTISLNDPYAYGMQYEGVIGHVCPPN